MPKGVIDICWAVEKRVEVSFKSKRARGLIGIERVTKTTKRRPSLDMSEAARGEQWRLISLRPANRLEKR